MLVLAPPPFCPSEPHKKMSHLFFQMHFWRNVYYSQHIRIKIFLFLVQMNEESMKPNFQCVILIQLITQKLKNNGVIPFFFNIGT